MTDNQQPEEDLESVSYALKYLGFPAENIERLCADQWFTTNFRMLMDYCLSRGADYATAYHASYKKMSEWIHGTGNKPA